MHRTFWVTFMTSVGTKVGLKIKFEKSNPEPKLADIDKEWRKLNQLSTRRNSMILSWSFYQQY